MKHAIVGAFAAGAAALLPQAGFAQTEIQFWHAFTGRLGDLVAEQVENFNANNAEYKIVASHKGNYSETLNAGIAAFRAGEQPHILMVFEVGTATMMAAEGAIRPVYQLMADSGVAFDPDAYIGPSRAITRQPKARCFRFPSIRPLRFYGLTATLCRQRESTPMRTFPLGRPSAKCWIS